MSSYVQEVEKQNEELQKKLADLQERYESLYNSESCLTSLYCEKDRGFSSKNISDLFKVPKLVINSLYRRPCYFINRTLDEAVLYVILNKDFGSAIFKHRLWTIECACVNSENYNEYEFRGTIYISSDLRTRFVDIWFKDNESKIVERVNTLLDHGEYELDENGMARL